MAEYIEREAVVRYLLKCADGYSYIETPTEQTIQEVNAIPAADVLPVVRAKWEKRYNSYLKCSNCHDPYSTIDVCGCKQSRNFCPNCGARMDGDRDV